MSKFHMITELTSYHKQRVARSANFERGIHIDCRYSLDVRRLQFAETPDAIFGSTRSTCLTCALRGEAESFAMRFHLASRCPVQHSGRVPSTHSAEAAIDELTVEIGSPRRTTTSIPAG